MNKSTRSRLSAFLVFLILLPAKFAFLTAFGTQVEGSIISLSQSCDYYGITTEPQPRIDAIYLIGNEQHQVEGEAGYGNPEFCDLRIGEKVGITYFNIPRFHYTIEHIGNPKTAFLFFFWSGFVINDFVFFGTIKINIKQAR